MRIDLFSIPIFINNIDSSKIVVESTAIKKNWNSETKSSHGSENYISKESTKYLFDIVNESMKDFIKNDYKIELLNIWENFYNLNDFQEKHVHVKSDFSFVIYKKINESRTIFFSPNSYLIESFYEKTFLESYFKTQFQPKLRENQILIFPSFLEHMVKKNENENITISGNISINKLS
jgi:hypothetical protein